MIIRQLALLSNNQIPVAGWRFYATLSLYSEQHEDRRIIIIHSVHVRTLKLRRACDLPKDTQSERRRDLHVNTNCSRASVTNSTGVVVTSMVPADR